MIDDVGRELSSCGLGLHASNELAAWRTHELNLDERKAFVESLYGFLLNFGEVGCVIDHCAFFLSGLDQFRRTKILSGGRKCGQHSDERHCSNSFGDLIRSK